MRKLLLAAIIFAVGPAAFADMIVNCSNGSGTCVVQGYCIRDGVDPDRFCADKCAGGTVTSISSPATCPAPPAGGASTPSYPQPVTEREVQWCAPIPPGQDTQAFIRPLRSGNNTYIRPKLTSASCIVLQPGVKISAVYCRSSQANADRFCSVEPPNDSKNCGDDHGYVVSEGRPRIVAAQGSWQACVEFHNDSHDADKSFLIWVK